MSTKVNEYAMLLLKSQKNVIFNLIKSSELEPFNFIWSERPSKHSAQELISILTYDGTDFFFAFESKRGVPYSVFSPGEEITIEADYPESWQDQQTEVRRWLRYLKNEISQPDLWEEVYKYQTPEIGRPSEDTNNSSFTFTEVEHIQLKMEEIRAYLLKNYAKNDTQIKLVNEKLDYLIQSSKKFGRKDWLNIAIGTLVTLSSALALPPEHTKTIWVLLKAAVVGIIKLLS
jgi:hypothetical protein